MMLTGSIDTPIQRQYIGVVIDSRYTIIDAVETEAGDFFILCLNSENPVHKFVSWTAEKDNPHQRGAGHYSFTLQEALDDFNNRVGRHAEIEERS